MLIITGSLAYDYIMDFPGSFSDHILPEHTHNINLSFIVNKFAKRRGGTAGNVSYTLGLLKTPHILFSWAGNDFESYKEDFAKLGINVKHVEIDKEDHTATGFAMSDKNQNQIWGYYYGAMKHNKDLKLKPIANKKDLVLIGPQGAKASLSLINQCITQEIPYMFDPGFILTQVTNEDLQTGLKHAKYIIGNEYEMQLMRDRLRTFAKLIEKKIVITTLGKKGATIDAEVERKRYKIKSAKATKVVSSTGAGDAWRGGFLAGTERGFDFQTSGQMGAVASSFAVEHIGTQEHVFTIKEFAKRYKETYNAEITL
ncbi:MAG TPA: PfkB family carbohydrate kinase [Candidatus Saccharimonadales bacterium]|nr:PfkB family carbohydrate kinase [Candidatus Saccharimonadales bacterium]